MAQSGKYTYQVLFVCLFTVSFFVCAAALRTTAKFLSDKIGPWAPLLLAAMLSAAAFVGVMHAARRMARCIRTQSEEGVVIYSDGFSMAAAFTVIALVSVFNARDCPLAYFGTAAGCVLLCAVRACRYHQEWSVYVSLFAQLFFPVAAPFVLILAALARRSRADAKPAALLKSVESITAGVVLSFAVPQSEIRRSILHKREQNSFLSLKLALLPLVFVMVIRLLVGDDASGFLQEAFALGSIPVGEEISRTSNLHHSGA